MLKSATRRIAIQTAAVLAVVVTVAVVGLAVAFDRAQHAQIERTVRSAARTADDVGDPPPGVLLVESHDGTVELTPGAPSYLRSLSSGPTGKGSAALAGHYFVTFTAVRDGRKFTAAYDLASHHDEETRLLWTSVAAGLLGIALATAAGSVIGRRSVRPMATALTLQRRFVTDASHELRTPLTVLHTRAQLIRRRLAPSADPEQLRDLDQLVEDTSSLGEVVADLLLSAQLQNDRVSGETVDMGDLAGAVARSLRPYAASHGTSLEARVQNGEWLVSGAPAALRRALGALVDNAISHAPKGAVVVEVAGDNDTVNVSVQDDGEGFDPDDATLLTDRFSRGESTVGGRRFGLGLALVDEVVRAHGGTLTFSGARGQGARVTIRLNRLG
jgi:signal transduction histidine kinase